MIQVKLLCFLMVCPAAYRMTGDRRGVTEVTWCEAEYVTVKLDEITR